MKNLLIGALVPALIGAGAIAGFTPAPGQHRPAQQGTGNRLAGAWRLDWLEQPGADGQLRRIDCCGLLVYTPDGHMSVQVMQSYTQAQAAAARSNTRRAVTKLPTAPTLSTSAQVRTLVGRDVLRAYQLSGNQLIVNSTRQDEHWRVAWKRY